MKIGEINKTAFIVIFLVFFLCDIQAQDFDIDYKPIRNYKLNTQTRNTIKGLFKTDLAQLNNISKKEKETQSESIIALANNFMMLDSVCLLMQGDTLTSYLNKIVKRIQTHNPCIANNTYYVFTYRTDVPNASNSGNGLIYVNLDLISKLNSESDLAYIICHELSHDYKDHVFEGIRTKAILLQKKGYQKQIQRAGKSYYNTAQKTELALSRFLSEYTFYGRMNEMQADSFGLFLFTNAGYKPSEAVTTLFNLDESDRPLFYDTLNLKKLFDFPLYPFKDAWLSQNSFAEKIGQYSYSVIPDSLKTHPDCEIRAEKLKEIIKLYYTETNDGIKNTGDYTFYNTMAHFEEIELLLLHEAYGIALFNSLHLLKQYPNNIYLHSAVTTCLYEIHLALQNHRFSKVVEFPNSQFSFGYNQFLSFLHNLNASSMKNILLQYKLQHLEKSKSISPFAAYICLLISTLQDSEITNEAIIQQYSINNTDTFYMEKLKSKLKKTRK